QADSAARPAVERPRPRAARRLNRAGVAAGPGIIVDPLLRRWAEQDRTGELSNRFLTGPEEPCQCGRGSQSTRDSLSGRNRGDNPRNVRIFGKSQIRILAPTCLETDSRSGAGRSPGAAPEIGRAHV